MHICIILYESFYLINKSNYANVISLQCYIIEYVMFPMNWLFNNRDRLIISRTSLKFQSFRVIYVYSEFDIALQFSKLSLLSYFILVFFSKYNLIVKCLWIVVDHYHIVFIMSYVSVFVKWNKNVVFGLYANFNIRMGYFVFIKKPSIF